MRIYLAGSVHQGWYREYVITNYGKFFDLVDPLHEERVNHVYESENPHKEIIRIDKKEMNKSDLIVAYVNYPSYGTIMEICYAKEVLDIPVYVINPSGKEIEDPWLEQYCDKWFNSIDLCFENLKKEAKEERKEMGREEIRGRAEPLDGDGKFGNMGEDANKGMTRDDSTTSTRLLDKNWSPLIVRKYQMMGWPMFVAMICDADLTDLDKVIYNIFDRAEGYGLVDGTIQGTRNVCGFLNDELVKYYNQVKKGVVEGVLIFWYVDKLACSAAYGDLMTHEKSVAEVYHIINTLPHI